MNIEVQAENFTRAIRTFAEKMRIGIGQAIKLQARQLAERLRALTYPATQKQGQDRVEADIHRVYLRGQNWFEQRFSFRNEKLRERVVKAVQAQDADTLGILFNRSAKLRRVEIEEFSEHRHTQSRDNRGRVRLKQPISFPVRGQGEAVEYIKRRQRAVGSVRGSWGRCVVQLGGKSPAWLDRSGGSVRDFSDDKERPSVTLINASPTAASVMERTGIVGRALQGRASAMVKAADKAIESAKKFARF